MQGLCRQFDVIFWVPRENGHDYVYCILICVCDNMSVEGLSLPSTETCRAPAAALCLEGASLGHPEAQAPHSVTVGGPLQLSTPPRLSPPHFQLLGLSTATMAVVTHFGDHFIVIRQVALERNPYEAMHYWGKYGQKWLWSGRWEGSRVRSTWEA